MANNELSFNQCATLLNAIQAQATGKVGSTALDETEFVTVAQTVLKSGNDLVINAISQVLSKTIFSVRPYTRKFKGLANDAIAYGNHVRKLAVIDSDAVDEDKYALTDGQSVDHYVVRKPKVLQTNFYGFNAYEDYITIFSDQLNQAFSSSSEFGQFMSMIMTNISDKREQWYENLGRAVLANLIKGCHHGSGSEFHLVTEYNNKIGNLVPPTDPDFDPTEDQWLTLADLYKPANYKAFVQFIYARVTELSDMMTERTGMFQLNITDKPIMRHTPKSEQLFFLRSGVKIESEMMALADIYHDSYLKDAITETLTFFQTFKEPDSINTRGIFMDTSGQLLKEGSATKLSNIFGVICDRNAAGYTEIYNTVDATPFNARGRYYNLWYHTGARYWNDFTEKSLVLYLD